MAHEYPFLVPTVTAVVLSPNPVDQNKTYSITATLSEKTIILFPIERYAGQYDSGEV